MRSWQRLALGTASLFGAFCIAWVGDRLLGALGPVEHSLLFEPYTLVHYASSEFEANARIGPLGFRDGSHDLSDTTRTRVAVVGDSFTFGWGVDDGEAWPAQLENLLGEAGKPAYVFNLGQPGNGPLEYADVVERVLPVLEPDLVIVGLLQADDLLQARVHTPPPQPAPSWRVRLGSITARLFPHSVRLRDRWRPEEAPVTRISDIWGGQVRGILQRLTAEQRARYGAIPSELRQLFEGGQLNPGLLVWGIHQPTAIAASLDPENREMQVRHGRVVESLRRISGIVRAHQAAGLVLSLPNGLFTSPSVSSNALRMGVDLPPDVLTTRAMDERLASAADLAGLSFAQVTEAFRAQAPQHRLYFPLDGHMTPAGHRLLAEQLTPTVLDALGKETPR